MWRINGNNIQTHITDHRGRVRAVNYKWLEQRFNKMEWTGWLFKKKSLRRQQDKSALVSLNKLFEKPIESIHWVNL